MKIVIATPAYGETFYTSYVQSLFQLTRALERRKWSSQFSTVTYFDVAESRNILLTQWYDKTDATHLLFIDADMGFEPQLIFDMIEFDKPVIGTIYPKRQIDLEKLSKLAGGGHPTERAIASAFDYVVRQPKSKISRNGFIEVEGCGTGIFLLKRSCIDTMLEKIPDLADPRPSSTLAKGFKRIIRAFDLVTIDGQRLSEDYSFCHRWRHDCGGEIWANINHEIVHVGLQRFKARYADAYGPRVTLIQKPISDLRQEQAPAPRIVKVDKRRN